MNHHTNRAFASITGHRPRRSFAQRITAATVYTLLGGLAIWAGLAIGVGIIRTITGT